MPSVINGEIKCRFWQVPNGWEFQHHGLIFQRELDACAFSNCSVESDHSGPIWNAALRKNRPIAKQRRFCFYPGAEVTIPIPNCTRG